MLDYVLIRAHRRSVSMFVRRDLSIVVRAPMNMPKHSIDDFVSKHESWAVKHIDTIKSRATPSLSDVEISALKKEAAALLTQKVEKYSRIMGVSASGVKITSAATRWGSCSGKNSLCFSYRLVLLPESLIDYIVVHELCHIRVKNHSSAFYTEVARYMPDYKERVRDLRTF